MCVMCDRVFNMVTDILDYLNYCASLVGKNEIVYIVFYEFQDLMYMYKLLCLFTN